MKKIVALVGLALITAGAFAQERTQSTYPSGAITKDVQRLQLKNVEYVPATIETGNSVAHISKGVHLINVKQSATPGTVKMTGMPASVITKGVARMQYERNKQD